MKLIKMVCPSCGAKLDVDKDKTEFVCEYCHTTTLLDDGVVRVEHTIKDENMDEKLKLAKGVFKGIGCVSVIPFIIFGIAFISIFAIIIVGIVPAIKSEFSGEDKYSKVEIQMFNSDFERYSGMQSINSVKDILNEVILVNNKKEHVVVVIYEGKSMTDSNEISTVIKSLTYGREYLVVLDYDEYGFVNEVTIS